MNLEKLTRMTNEFYTINEKRSIVAKLFKFSHAKRPMNPREAAYISHVAATLGLIEEDLTFIRTNLKDFKLYIPPGERERMTIFYYLLFLTRVDGKVNMEEEGSLLKEALLLGINHCLVLDLVAVLNFNDGNVPPKQMMSQIKKYLN